MFVVSCITRWARLNSRPLLFVLLALLAINALPTRVIAADKPLTALLPLDTPGYISVDTQYLWNASAEVRKSEVVAETISDMELATGLSFNDDVFSWTGQVATSFGEGQSDGYYSMYNILDSFLTEFTRGKIYIHIRDQAAYEKKFPAVQAELEKITRQEWKSVEYKGITLRQAELNEPSYDYRQNNQIAATKKIQYATIDGWVVFTHDEAGMQEIIDVSKGEKPSLEKHPLFANTMKDLPQGNVGSFCVNGTGILELVKKNSEEGATIFSATDYDKTLLIGTVNNDKTGVNTNVVACSSSPKIQEELKQLRAETGVLSGKSLAHSPAGTFAVAMINDPESYIAFVEKRILESLTNAEAKDRVGEWFNEYADPRSILKRITGEFTLSAAYNDEKGFGFTLAGETKSAVSATNAMAAFQGFAEDDKEKITVENGVFKLLNSEYKDDKNYFNILLSGTTRKEWLLLSSHPDWITQHPAAPAMALPADMKDVSMAVFGNFDFLPSLLKRLAITDPGLAKGIQDTLDTMTMKPDKWAISFSIDADGGAERAKISFPNDWITNAATSAITVATRNQVSGKKQSEIYRIQSLANQLKQYAREHDDSFPIMESPEDLKALKMHDYYGNNYANAQGVPYLPNPSLSLKGLGDIVGDPTKIILLYDETTWPNGAHTVAYLDGTGTIITADKWEVAKEASGIP